jgi:hypothetical protein
MEGLTDDEWSWLPTDDPQLGLRWRLDHIAEVLGLRRNAEWFGQPAGYVVDDNPSSSVTVALSRGDAAYESFRGLVDALDAAGLDETMGSVAGPYATATKRSFVFHIIDEVIHHTAEAALLRDLYALR